MWQVLLQHLLSQISSQCCGELWFTRETAWVTFPCLILWQSQINRVCISIAVWPLSHFILGPFRLFDLTSIPHVVDSPRDLFFSPISDSVSTFFANSLDNTQPTPLVLLFSPPPKSNPPPLHFRVKLVIDPCVFLPRWPLIVWFVSNLIFFSLLVIETIVCFFSSSLYCTLA